MSAFGGQRETEDVERRRQFIEAHAMEVKNLDV
jgi:hypothetical protein